jgi:hypothetical protein
MVGDESVLASHPALEVERSARIYQFRDTRMPGSNSHKSLYHSSPAINIHGQISADSPNLKLPHVELRSHPLIDLHALPLDLFSTSPAFNDMSRIHSHNALSSPPSRSVGSPTVGAPGHPLFTRPAAPLHSSMLVSDDSAGRIWQPYSTEKPSPPAAAAEAAAELWESGRGGGRGGGGGGDIELEGAQPVFRSAAATETPAR